MSTNVQPIRELLHKGEVDKAIEELERIIGEAQGSADDEVYYLLGNAHRKKGDWQQALNNYLEAMDRNPESPAHGAHAMLMDILNFYNKDMYNG